MAKSKGCGQDKKRYHSLQAATRDLLRLQQAYQGPEHKKPKRTYWCYKCKSYHLTSREY